MSSFDDLRRDNYHVDALRKAQEQEAAERLDGRARDAQPGHTVRARSRASRSADDGAYRSGNTVVRRPQPREEREPSGGAVASKRSGLAASLRRGMRERQAAQVAKGRQRRELRRERRQNRPPRHHGGLVFALVIAIVVVVGYLITMGPIDRALSFSADEGRGLSRELSWHVPGRPYYVLALGSDARDGETVSRSDTMILMRVDLLAGQLTMLSIPRDTKVEIEGYGTQKINAAYAFGGTAGAVRAVKDLCGVPISQAALVKFDGVQDLVDYLGGVTVEVPTDVYDPEYTGLVLGAGTQEMDGQTALLFSRVRHGFALGDYQRQIDQRLVIEAIMRKALSLPPQQLPGVMGHMGDMVSTSMRMYSLLPLALRFKLGGGPTIYQATVPSTTAMIDGVSYVLANEEELSEVMRVIDSGGDPALLGYFAGY